MGSAPGSQRRARIGPVILDSFAIAGFEPGGKSAALLSSGADLLSGAVEPLRSPLSVMIGAGTSLTVDLGKRQLFVPNGTMQVELSAHGPASGDRKAASFTNDKTLTIAFTDIAADKPLALGLKRTAGEVPLNIPEKFDKVAGAFPPPPIAATECRLGLTLASTGKAGALLTVARLAPQGGTTALTVQGIRNARNRAEHWDTGNDLDLVFRIGAGTIWSTPLLAPVDEERPPAFRRRDDIVEGKVVPMHGWFGASQFRPDKGGVAAKMFCDKNHVIDGGALIPQSTRICSAAPPGPWLRFEKTDFHHSRPGDSYQGTANTFIFETSAGHCGGAPMASARRLGGRAGCPKEPATNALKKANDAVNAAFGAMVLLEKDSVTRPASPTARLPTAKAILPRSRR